MTLRLLLRCTPAAALVFIASSGLAYAQFDARVQAIHNAPDPELAVVDLYVAGKLAVDDVAFRTASPFIDIFALFPLTGGVAPGNSTGPEDIFFEFPITFIPGETYQLILAGVRDPGLFLPNPDGRDISLEVLVNESAREVASDPGLLEANFVHGSTDAPAQDVEWSTAVADDLTYGDITDYASVSDALSLVLVLPSDGSPGLGYLPPSSQPGQALTLLLSGFEDPGSNQNGSFFGVLAVYADGQSVLLDPFPVSTEPDGSHPIAFTLRGNYPNPFNPSTTISFDLASPAGVSVEVFDVLGRNILTTATASFSAGAGHEFQLDASSLPSGTYLYRVLAELVGGVQVQTGRMTLLK